MERENKIGKKPAHTNFANSPACGQWETLLVDALDGLLKPEDEATFSGHMATCDPCGAMFEEAQRGREWLEFLAPEPEVPAYLLEKILVGTRTWQAGSGHGGPGQAGDCWWTGCRQCSDDASGVAAAWVCGADAAFCRASPDDDGGDGLLFDCFNAEPDRCSFQCGQAFGPARPAALRSVVEKRIMTASTPLIRYYDHLRFVYEVESTVKEIRRSSETEPQSQPSQQKDKPASNGEGESHKKDGGSKLDPNEAPQQTVNPPSHLWSGEVTETELRLEPHSHLNTNHSIFMGHRHTWLFPTN